MSRNNNHEKANKNSNYNHYQVGAFGRRIPARIEKVTPLLTQAREACQRLGGIAEISDGYVIIDTKLYTVNRKKGK